ncbi:hypothetical protein [Beijerinckia indica]|uniref:hypothetical protein n=1 Tax=Beijerinckia indica TaxID=533 RepID=UPI0011D16D76|nr:hypothetical protein [Beijerinckia indica]
MSLRPSGAINLPATTIEPGQPLALDLPSNLIDDAGGILSLLDPHDRKVDGVSYFGGPGGGWSTSFAT